MAYPAQIRKLRRIQYFPRLSVSDALRRSAGMATSRPKYSWTFLNPDLEATKANQRPAVQALPEAGIGRPGTAGWRRVRIPPNRRRAAPWRLAYEQVVTEDEPHPLAELVTITGRLRATSPSPAVPPTCPKHRSAAVSHGQPRSVRVPAEL